CSETMVNQFNMIRPFAGEGTILSVYAPLMCTACGLSFRELLDCEADRDVIDGTKSLEGKCPACSNVGTLEEDASTYFASARKHVSRKVEPRIVKIARALAKLERG